LQEAALSFRVSGRLIELPIRASVTVSEGDIIGQLDPRDFEAQITQLQSQLDQADAQLTALRAGARPGEIASLEAGIDAVVAQLSQATEQLERTQSLVNSGVATRGQLEQDEAAVLVAQAELRAKQEELTLARDGGRPEEIAASEAAIRGLEAQIQAARDNLDDATLRAPFDGIVARRAVENFTNIQAGAEIVVLQQLSPAAMAFDVPGPDVLELSTAGDIDTSVRLSVMGSGELDAELIEFTTQADASTQTYRGRVSVELPEGLPILPGMVGTVIARTAESDDAAQVSVPISALVSEGLSAGDVVVTAGVSRLQDGMAIRPITEIGG